eukprot:COSAG02_NODE_13426_length_1396_cov_36.773323_2_plen_75_part_01
MPPSYLKTDAQGNIPDMEYYKLVLHQSVTKGVDQEPRPPRRPAAGVLLAVLRHYVRTPRVHSQPLDRSSSSSSSS